MTRSSPLVRSKVGSDGGLAVVEDSEGLLRNRSDGKTRRGRETLLRSADNDINVPVILSNLLRGDRADSIENNQSLGADTLDELADGLGVRKYTGCFV